MIRYFCDKCGKEIGQYEGMKVKWEMGTSQLAFKPWDGDNEGGIRSMQRMLIRV